MADFNEKLNKDKAGMFITTILLFLISIPGSWWTGFVIFKLYNWFILPIQGAPTLNIENIVGFNMIVSLAFYGFSRASTSESFQKQESWSEVFSDSLSKAIMLPLFFLVLGWCYKLFFM